FAARKLKINKSNGSGEQWSKASSATLTNHHVGTRGSIGMFTQGAGDIGKDTTGEPIVLDLLESQKGKQSTAAEEDEHEVWKPQSGWKDDPRHARTV
ncbi:hypothetical protein PQX77_001574, partial [Marasmius sp. AFHP31]